MLSLVRQVIRNNHARFPFRALASVSEKYLRAYYNEDFYDIVHNGEQRIINIFAAHGHCSQPTVLDVGAHTGHWSACVLRHLPQAEVYCFEIVSEFRKTLSERFKGYPNVHVMDFGLSSTSGAIAVTHSLSHGSASAIAPCLESGSFQDRNFVTVSERVEPGDRLDFLKIDYLKIDVEGHEVEVLRGFGRTLSSPDAPQLIQFEYGETYLAGPHTLREVYQLLTPHGYVIGRIFPRAVAFKEYEPTDDHFRMGNYLAVRRGNPILRLL